MKKVYIYIGLFGFLFNLVIGLGSYLVDDSSIFLVGNFLSNSLEPFIEQNGAVVNFDALELLTLSFPYLLAEVVLGLILFMFLYEKIFLAGAKAWKILLSNIIGFYIGFLFVGLSLLYVGVMAWRNFTGL